MLVVGLAASFDALAPAKAAAQDAPVPTDLATMFELGNLVIEFTNPSYEFSDLIFRPSLNDQFDFGCRLQGCGSLAFANRETRWAFANRETRWAFANRETRRGSISGTRRRCRAAI